MLAHTSVIYTTTSEAGDEAAARVKLTSLSAVAEVGTTTAKLVAIVQASPPVTDTLRAATKVEVLVERARVAVAPKEVSVSMIAPRTIVPGAKLIPRGSAATVEDAGTTIFAIRVKATLPLVAAGFAGAGSSVTPEIALNAIAIILYSYVKRF
jgi:hypothetical protein